MVKTHLSFKVALAVFLLAALSIAGVGMYIGSLWHVSDAPNTVFLTFDDGPSNNTLEVLRILDENDAKATFFVLGDNVREHEDITKQIVREGHAIGSHSMSHCVLCGHPEAKESKELIESVTNTTVKYFRPPRGYITPSAYIDARRAELTIVMWDVYPRDYAKGPDYVRSYILDKSTSGSIIVLHDGPGDRSGMLGVLPDIIKGLRSRGFEFSTLD